MSTSAKVIVVGAGIAGPALATFLKLKGYQPVIYERVSTLPDGGIGHLCVLLLSGIISLNVWAANRLSS
jgi:2-polyprenyl-6-methoxyphenol hydroxylase-like FAD-dependent oxidoreductase